MTSKRDRPEDLLREMRTAVVPVASPEGAGALRERTVSHLRGLQARAAVHREIRGAWRIRTLIAAAILLPSGALAMSQVPWLRAAVGLRSAATEPEAPRSTPPKRGNAGHVVAAPAIGDVAPPVPADREPSPPAPNSAVPAVGPTAPVAGNPAALSHNPWPHRSTEQSTLSEENRLMQAALAAARGGDDAQAITRLNELLSRYPASPLAQNAKVERFRALARSGAAVPAAAEARRYLNEHPNGMASDEARTLAAEPTRPEPGNARFP